MKGLRPTHLYPDRMGRIVLLAMEEILGRSGVNALLRSVSLAEYIDPPSEQDLAIPFEHIAALQAALESTYGTRAGRGLALRAGRACFKYGLREFGPELGVTSLAFRLLPLPAKLETGGRGPRSLLNKYLTAQVSSGPGSGTLFLAYRDVVRSAGGGQRTAPVVTWQWACCRTPAIGSAGASTFWWRRRGVLHVGIVRVQ